MKLGLILKLVTALLVVVGGGFYLVNALKPTAVVAEARRSVAVRSVPGTVLVRAEKEMMIRSELGGRAIKSNLVLGGKVNEGDLLLEMDPGDVDLAIEKVRLDIEAAQRILDTGSSRRFSLAAAKDALEDVQRRYDRGGASKTEVDARERSIDEIEQAIETETNAMEARLAQLENELKSRERQKEKMSIRAPVDGVITEVYAYRGDLVRGGQEVAKIISRQRVVEVQVSEENFAGVAVGQLARVKFLGYGDDTFSGIVSKTLPVADAETQRYTVHLDMEIDQEKLFPGLTGEATITLDERADAVIIPGAAIIGNKVFLVKDGVVSIQSVEKGYGDMTKVEVKSGLDEGDRVIVEQLELFKAGDQVRTEVRAF